MCASTSVTPSSVFDSYQDSTSASNAEFTEYFTAFLPFLAYIFVTLTLTRITSLQNSNDSYIIRAYFYLYSVANEVRFQFEAALQVFFFVFMYTSMMVDTFDDAQDELLEFFNTLCYYFFIFTFIYYLFKYSLHYFSFLEAAKGDSKSTPTFSQFLFDALNIIAFVLRFLVLMIRLNIYDGVDDVLDSYYIFMADFDEEEYFTDTFFSLFSVMSFDTDLNDDRSFLFEDELDFVADLFTVYFLL
jgi:NhaP-type Na+/H+ or K+/H+ antiporter